MKRAYVRPTMVGERFVANEYVAACGDTEYGKYKFVCDAGDVSAKYNVYYKKGNRKVYIANNDIFSGAQFGYYHPCNTTHEADTKDEFTEGFIDDQSTWKDEAIPVIIWTENGTNVHCTTNLDRDSWETTKS